MWLARRCFTGAAPDRTRQAVRSSAIFARPQQGRSGIGISSVIQPEDLEDTSQSTVLVLMIHDARLGDMKAAIEAIAALDCVRGEPVWMRVETLQGR